MAQIGFAQHNAIELETGGQRLFEHTVLANRKAEREVYASNYKRFRKMGLDALDKKFDNKFRVDSFDPTRADTEEEEGIVSQDDLKAAHDMPARALKRAYGQEIIERMENQDRISDKQKAFLVKDFIENNGAGTIANLFLKMHGFRSWNDLFDQAGVSQKEVQAHYVHELDENMIGFGDVDINDDLDKTFLQKHGKTLVRGAILTGATVATGGAGLVASAAGMVGGAIGRRVARYFAHDRHVKGKNGKTSEDGHKWVEDLSQMSRGMEMVTSIIDDYLAVRDEIRAKVIENRELRLARQTAEAADSQREHFAFSKDVMDLEDGRNLLAAVMKSFADKASENISKDDKVGKYWAQEKVSRRWELFGGIVGGVIAGGAGAALHAKMESFRLMEQINSGQGAMLNLDGDAYEHMVRLMQNPENGQMEYMWQLGAEDAARVGNESLSGWTHTFISQEGVDMQIIQGGSFDAAALSSLSPDQITVHATSLNISEEALMQNLFMNSLLTNALTVGGVAASAILLDNLHYQMTGNQTTKNRKLAQNAIGSFVEYSSQRRRAGRQDTLDKQLTPDTAQEVEKRRQDGEKAQARQNFQDTYLGRNPGFKEVWDKISQWEGKKDNPTIFIDVTSHLHPRTTRGVDELADEVKRRFDAFSGVPYRPVQVAICLADVEAVVVPGNANYDSVEKVLAKMKERLGASYDESAFDQLVLVQKGLNDTFPDTQVMLEEMRDVVTTAGGDPANVKVESI